MATRFYMGRQRWIATLVLGLSVLLVWWAVGVRLGSATEIDRQRARQQALEFKINALRWQRDALNTSEFKQTRELARAKLLPDPDGLAGLVDELQDLAARSSIEVAINIGERIPYEQVDRIYTRDLTLRFNGVVYDSLIGFLQALEERTDQWVFMLRDLNLTSRGGDVEVNGWLKMRIWTQPAGASTEQESLF